MVGIDPLCAKKANQLASEQARKEFAEVWELLKSAKRRQLKACCMIWMSKIDWTQRSIDTSNDFAPEGHQISLGEAIFGVRDARDRVKLDCPCLKTGSLFGSDSLSLKFAGGVARSSTEKSAPFINLSPVAPAASSRDAVPRYRLDGNHGRSRRISGARRRAAQC